MKEIHLTYTINASPAQVWQALVDPEQIEGWGAGPAEMSEQPGTEFSLWGGEIWGKNIEMVPEKRIVQEWCEGEWPEPSILTLEISPAEAGAQVLLTQTNVPDEEADEVEDGWTQFYFGPLKEFIEL